MRVRGINLECAAIALQPFAAGHTPRLLDEPVHRHVESCLRCQADLAAHRKLRRSLRDLRSVQAAVEQADIDTVLSGLRPRAPVHELPRGSRRRASVGGVAAALTAASAGAVIVAARLTTRSAFAS